RAVRRELAERGLDWNLPPFPSADPEEDSPRPSRVTVELGPLAQPALTREERARKAIEEYRRKVEAKPNDAQACNNLAWMYLTGLEAVSDVEAALPLAERAVQREPKNTSYRNTLGVAYYRTGRYRQAAETLHANLKDTEDQLLAWDLYFLAMSYQRLGE